jgi:exodeoxyribonuclease-3
MPGDMMRLATWNCYRGDLRRRAAHLAEWRPDVLVLQECSRPEGEPDGSWVWCGANPKLGVGAVAGDGYRLEPVPCDPLIGHSVFPVRVTGKASFNLLMVWSQAKPTYVASIRRGLDAYAGFIASGPTIILGDFNSLPGESSAGRAHEALAARLREEFGLMSAFDTAAAAPHASAPTLYYQWQKKRPFQIDYCWLPEAWASNVREVRVGAFEEFTSSDHRPVMVELALPDAAPRAHGGSVGE